MNPLPVWLKILLAVIVLSGLYWRVDIYHHRPWTTDEVNQYNVGHDKLLPFWKPAYYAEAHSFPGDYLLTLPFIKLFHQNRWGIALPHLLSTLIGFYVLYLLCRRYFKHPAAWLVTFFAFALHRELIFHALELRPYSVLVTLGLSTFYILDCLIDPSLEISSLKSVCWWIILIMTIIYHPYGLFMLICYGLFLLLRDWRKPGFMTLIRHRWMFWLSLWLIGGPLWLYYIQGSHQNSLQSMKWHQIDVFQFIPNPLINPCGFIKSVGGNLTGSPIARLLSLGVLARLLWPAQDRLQYWGFTLLIVALPILLLLISDTTIQYWFLQRQYIWVMAIFPFFLGKCWDDIFNVLNPVTERRRPCL